MTATLKHGACGLQLVVPNVAFLKPQETGSKMTAQASKTDLVATLIASDLPALTIMNQP